MRSFWVYDWEVYKNFACVTFIHTTTPQAIIDAYVKVDIKYLEVSNKLKTEDDVELYAMYSKLKEAKKILLKEMISKQFSIYYDPKTGGGYSQLGELLMFFRNHKVLIGYNSINYDSKITDFIVTQGHKYDAVTGRNLNNIHILQELKKVSDTVVSMNKETMFQFKFDWLPKYYKRTYEDYDIQKILYLDKTFVGLKSVAINLRWHRIQELPIHFDNIIGEDQIYTILDYNVNDVLITHKLVMSQDEEITLREQISEQYDLNVLNDSRSSIGKALMTKYYSDETGLDYKDFKDLRTIRGKIKLSSVISDKIVFKTKKFNDLLESLKDKVVSAGDDFGVQFECNGTYYSLGKGGIHSIDDSRIFDGDKDKCIYRDADVVSYYPSIIELFKVSPKHIIKTAFIKLVSFFKNDRVAAKKEGRKLAAEALKIVINRIYGALSDIMDYLFDSKATYTVTLNGQLSLLMLIEELEENDIHVISANTDGIVSKIQYDQEELYNTICKEWEQTTEFELEYTDYERYARSNVNNYVAIKKGFSKTDKTPEDVAKYVKGKGSYIYETPFNKGFVHPIVSKALFDYLVFNKDYKDTIKEHVNNSPFNIYDYCLSQKVDKKFDVYHTYVDSNGIIQKDALQQYNRFYITTRGGGSITKEDVHNGKARVTNLMAGKKCAVFNDYVWQADYAIDFSFYIRKVEDYLYYRKKKSKGDHKLEGILVRSINLFDQQC